MNKYNVFVARSALSRGKAQNLKGAKLDRSALDFVTGAMSYAMASHGEDSSEAAALGMVAMMCATRGAVYLSDMVARADAEAAAAAAAGEGGDAT